MNVPNINPIESQAPVTPQQPTPMGVPSMIGQQPTSTLSQEQMKSNLQDLMSKIEGQYQDFNSQKFAADNRLADQQSVSLSQVYDLFESMGVDPNDAKAVQAVLDKIRAQNPKLSELIESTLSSMMGDETEALVSDTDIALGQEVPLEENNMNMNYETSQKTI